MGLQLTDLELFVRGMHGVTEMVGLNNLTGLNLTVASPTAKLPNLIDSQYFRLYGSLVPRQFPAQRGTDDHVYLWCMHVHA